MGRNHWATRPRALIAPVVLALMAIGADGPPAVAIGSGAPETTVIPLMADRAWVAGLAMGAGAVWVANGRAGTVSRLDPRTNEVVANIPVADPSPTCERCWGAVAGRGDVVWATMNSAGPVVARIDPVSNRVAQTIPVEVLPFALGVGEDGGLWLTATLENAVVRVDPRVGRVVEQIPVHAPSGIAVDKDAIWVTTRKLGANGQVVRLDPRAVRVAATIPVGYEPGAVVVDDGGVWVANEADHTISRIDPRTNTVVATIPVVHLPIGLAIGEGAVWVASRGFSVLSRPSVSRIDPVTNTVVEIAPIEGTSPVGMVAAEGSLWVASRNPDEVVRIGPVLLPAGTSSVGAPPLLPLALGMGTGLLLTLGAVLQHSSRQGGGRSAPDSHLLVELLRMRQRASHRGDAREVSHQSLPATTIRVREDQDMSLFCCHEVPDLVDAGRRAGAETKAARAESAWKRSELTVRQETG